MNIEYGVNKKKSKNTLRAVDSDFSEGLNPDSVLTPISKIPYE